MTPPDVLICRFKARPPTLHERIIKATPALVLVAVIYYLIREGWHWLVVLIALPAVAVFWFVTNLYARQRETQRDATIEIDTQRAQFTFRNFRFVSTFLPEQPRPEEVVRFDEVIGVSSSQVRGDTPALDIRTAKGTVVVSSEMENFEFLEDTLEDLAEVNLKGADENKDLATEPEINTPWWGWLILVAALALFAYLIRKFMYSE